jgi:hypothetical protein
MGLSLVLKKRDSNMGFKGPFRGPFTLFENLKNGLSWDFHPD